MNNFISNAKEAISKAIGSAPCRVLIARSVVAYMIGEFRLLKLHPVRDRRERELVGYKVRAHRLTVELAVKKLSTI
jgi:hypothetical protein